MERKSTILNVSSADQIPSVTEILKIPREEVLKIIFIIPLQEQKFIIGNRLKEELTQFQVLISNIDPVIHIARLITDQEIYDNALFFEKCAHDYRQLAHHLIYQLADKLQITLEKEETLYSFNQFKTSSSQSGQVDDWRYFFHGIHCNFFHRKTKQEIEVCLAFGPEFGDLDPYFFSRFIKSTAAYRPLPVEIYEDYADGARINEKMISLGRFENIDTNNQFKPGVVITNREILPVPEFPKRPEKTVKPGFDLWRWMGLSRDK